MEMRESDPALRKRAPTLVAGLTGAALALGAVAAVAWTGAGGSDASGAPLAAARADDAGLQDQQAMMMKLAHMAPYRGYLKAHAVQNPPDLLGGPLHFTVTQDGGGVHVALPDHRQLDENVFGTPEHPRAFAGTPVIDGLPASMRETSGGHFTRAKPLSPFGDKTMVMGGAHLMFEGTDATATDGLTTKDRVKFDASWKDEDGNTYEVKCCKKLATHGLEYPTFGGVLTNHMMHGSTRIGTALMPTMWTYADFWGMGQILKNGKVLQAPRLIHGMLTEYVRTEGYKLGSDEQVTPGRMHFHLMVPPAMPDMDKGMFEKSPVRTGLTLPNGKELPFWHVMFGNVSVSASRGQ